MADEKEALVVDRLDDSGDQFAGYDSTANSGLATVNEKKKTQWKVRAAFAVIAAVVIGVVIGVAHVGESSSPGPSPTPSPSTVTTSVSFQTATGQLALMRGKDAILLGKIGQGVVASGMPKVTTNSFGDKMYTWPGNTASLTVGQLGDSCVSLVWMAQRTVLLRDCFFLTPTTDQWFGGGAMTVPTFPLLQKVALSPFRTSPTNPTHEDTLQGEPLTQEEADRRDNNEVQDHADSAAAAAAMDSAWGSLLNGVWFSSNGAAINVSTDTPLHISFNSTNVSPATSLCMQANASHLSTANLSTAPSLRYTLCGLNSLHELQTNLFSQVFQQPTRVPDNRLLQSTMFSTSVRFGSTINQSAILKYAKTIHSTNFTTASHIQLDRRYQAVEGDLAFDPALFPSPSSLSQQLGALGFRLTLRVSPFFANTSSNYAHGTSSGYWVKAADGKPLLVQGPDGVLHGSVLDFTLQAARDWFRQQLSTLLTANGVDSFFFDMGQTSIFEQPFVLSKQLDNIGGWVREYSTFAADFGSLAIIDSQFYSQGDGALLSMGTRESTWAASGFLGELSTALSLSTVGMPYVVPGAVGGTSPLVPAPGGSGGLSDTEELYVRWMQLAVFLPVVHLSVLPSDFGTHSNVSDLVAQAMQLRANTTAALVEQAARDAVASGGCVICPLWYGGGGTYESSITRRIGDQFMIGSRLLVAPVLDKGATSRRLYLPLGNWLDHQRQRTHVGPGFITLPATIDSVFYFTLQ